MVTVALNKARYGGGRPSRPDHINEFPELLFCKTCCVFADYNEMVEKKDKLYRYCCPTCGDPLRLKFQGKQCGFFCRFCGRRVRDICDLKKHERTHTGEKPYHCTTCDRRFSQISNWKGHRCEILVSGANMDYMPLALAKIENNQNTSGKNMCYVPLSIVKSDAQNSGGVNISTEHGSVVTKVGQVSTTIDEDEMPAADSNAQQGDIDKDVQIIIANIKAQHSKNDTWSAAVSNSETEQMVGNEDDSVQLVITSIESQGSNVETLDMQVVQTDSE